MSATVILFRENRYIFLSFTLVSGAVWAAGKGNLKALLRWHHLDPLPPSGFSGVAT